MITRNRTKDFSFFGGRPKRCVRSPLPEIPCQDWPGGQEEGIPRQDGDQQSCSVADRDACTDVIAYRHDNKGAEKKRIEVRRKRKTAPKEERPLPTGVLANKQENERLVGDRENVKELRHVCANQSNAMRAARAEWESGSAAWPNSRSP